MYNTEGVLVKAGVRSCHEHATKEYTISSQALREVINRFLMSPSGWSNNSSMLYGLLQNEIQYNKSGQIKSRVSSVKHFIRCVKKRYFMSYDIMDDERLKALFVPFDPMDERNLLNNDIIILCNKEKMKRLSGVNYILMDGTFNVAPHGFIQMYTIHGAFMDNSHFTMFYVLMRKRRADDYERLFSRLQQCCVQEFNLHSLTRTEQLSLTMRKQCSQHFAHMGAICRVVSSILHSVCTGR